MEWVRRSLKQWVFAVLCWSLLLAAVLLCSIPLAEAVVADEEFVGPFASWTNVKTTYGAVGNGVADDTAALQAALDALGVSPGVTVLYFPAGTYLLTSQLILAQRQNVALIGEDPATTMLKWASVTPSRLLWLNGVAYSRFERLTFDGNGVALIAVDQSWIDNQIPYFDSGNEYADDVFKNVGIGIRGGAYDFGFAETTVLRSTFLNNTTAGILMGNGNALDLYVWYTTFQNCNKGITNIPGGGNFRVYNSFFQNSTIADMETGATGGFSIRSNTSMGSAQFLKGSGADNNPAYIILQGNTIIDHTNSLAIELGNQGPLFLLDNIIASPSAQTVRSVYHVSSIDQDTISIGNTYTVSSPIQVGGSGRLVTIDDITVARTSLTVGAPSMPTTPTNHNRTIFEVPSNASTAVLQQTITTAVAAPGPKAVVHIPTGTYTITDTLLIPANTDIQVIGDGYGASQLQWGGVGGLPVLSIKGPSKATVQDIFIHGQTWGDGIVIETVDQPGSRVFLGQTEIREGAQTHLWVDGLDYTQVDIRNFGSAYMPSGVSVKVLGGTQAAAGNYLGARTDIFSGASASNPMNYVVTNGGRLLIRDMWYETPNNLPGFATLSNTAGVFSIEGSRIALPANQSPPAIAITAFRGDATFLLNDLDDRIVIAGDGSATNVLALGMIGRPAPYVVDTSAPAAHVVVTNSRQAVTNIPGNGSIPVANQGTQDPVFIKAMLTQTRTAEPRLFTDLPAGVSDVRLRRLWITNTQNGIHLLPGTPRIDVAWDYTQEPTHLATSFVLQRCTMVSPATPCTTFADLPAAVALPLSPLTFSDTTIQLTAVGYCYQGLAADTGGRSTVSNSTCVEFMVLTPSGAVHTPWAMGMFFSR